MKILIISNCATGLETFRGMLIKELVKRKDVVRIILPEVDEEKEIQAENRIKAMECKIKKIPMERRGMNPLRDLNLAKEYYKTIKKLKPDFIITYTIKPNIYGGFVSRILKVPYAVNITGLGTAFQGNGMLRHLVTIMYKVALRKAKVVFFENTENRDIFVESRIISKDRTCVLAGAGVDLEHFHYSNYPEENETTKFLFIGRVMREKGIDELFEAMQRLIKNGYHCSLDIVGSFEEDYSDKIQRYQKDGWLNYLGYQNDVRPFIEQCHCFVLPSWHEGMANTNLECAATGRPVITSKIHGCMEAVEDGKTGYLCERKDVDSLYEVMKKMCELPGERRKEMGEAGRERMEDRFDKRKVVEKTINNL